MAYAINDAKVCPCMAEILACLNGSFFFFDNIMEASLISLTYDFSTISCIFCSHIFLDEIV